MTKITIVHPDLKFTKSLTTSILKTGKKKSGGYIVLDSHPDLEISLGADETASGLGLKKNLEVTLLPTSNVGTYTLFPVAQAASAPAAAKAPKAKEIKPTNVVEKVKGAVKSAAKKVKGDSPVNPSKITNRLD